MPDFGVDRVGVPCDRRGCVVVSATPGSKLKGLSVAPGDSCQGGAPDRGHHCFRGKRHHPRRKSDGFFRVGADFAYRCIQSRCQRKMRSTELWAHVRQNRCRLTLKICGDVDSGVRLLPNPESGFMQKWKFARDRAREWCAHGAVRLAR